jgi:putative tricarboxylic transport membrane protein
MAAMTALRRIEITAGTPPGGGQDRAARALAAAIDESGGPAVSVTNVVGRGGGAAWEALGARPGAGEVISISSPTMLTNHLHDPGEPGREDVTHLAILCIEPLVFAVPQASPLTSADDLLRALAEDPEKVRVAIATARGNVNHMAVAAVAAHAGSAPPPVDALPSAAAALDTALSGAASLAVVSAASALRLIADGVLRPLAVSSTARVGPPLDYVPIWTELGIDCALATWRGVVGPPGLTAGTVHDWEEVLATAVSTEAWQRAVDAYAWVPWFLVGEAAAEFVGTEEKAIRGSLAALGMLDG